MGLAAAHEQTPDERMEIDQDESKMRKRTRLSPCPRNINAAANQPQDPNNNEPPDTPIQDNSPPVANIAIDQSLFSRSPVASPAELPKAQPVLSNRPAESLRQKSRKRAGTPPLVAQRNKLTGNVQSGDTPSEIIDPVRAALTWHEDEITVYDPDDADDDGVGINGIGFKPTPAIAYARTMKKRQQLAEYRKREEREARARRSYRRRGSPERSPPKLERKQTARKVRFKEAEPSMMIKTIQ